MTGSRSTARSNSMIRTKAKGKDKNTKKVRRHQCDFTLLASVLMLNIIGIIMITSSSFYYAYNKFGDSYHFLKKQLMWFGISVVVMMIFMNFDYKILKKFAVLIYLASLVFLIAVIFVGQEYNGAKRWLNIGGPIGGFQPSEFTKIAIIIFMAYYLSRYHEKIRNPRFYLRCLALVLIPVAIIAVENLSTAIVVIVIGVALIFISGAKIKHMLLTALPVLGGGSLFVILPLLNIPALSEIAEKFSYRLARVEVWFDPWSDPGHFGFQTIQSLYAVGSGGLFGIGLGQSIQKRGFIPEPVNDIIFSVLCEELGLIGAIIVLFLFLVLIWRGIKVAMNSADLFGGLLAAGAVVQIAIQVIINVAVNTNTIPVTGMPLPFISYGGSSLLFLMTSMGILLNVSRFTKKS